MSRNTFVLVMALAFVGVLFLGLAFFGPDTKPTVVYGWLSTIFLLVGVLCYSVYKHAEEVTRRLRNPFG